MDTVNWGIIGCGDVTEVKSGPAFQKVRNSDLIAVMRRNEAKCRDYAMRHHVPKWYTDANELISDPDVNAIYIATPPSSHEEYAIAALKAGKPVYLEKPMTTSVSSAIRIRDAVKRYDGKLVMAHYRRAQLYFKQIGDLIAKDEIGKIKFVESRLFRKNLTAEQLRTERYAWRVDVSVAGGGLFHDMAPHQLDILYHFFGDVSEATGISVARNELYHAPDMVTGNILFKNNVLFNGLWCFDIGNDDEQDSCVITGEHGTIGFSFFDRQEIRITSTVKGKTRTIVFEKLQHVQQPMIEAVVGYFSGKNPNPNPVEEGVEVMKLLEKLSGKTLS